MTKGLGSTIPLVKHFRNSSFQIMPESELVNDKPKGVAHDGIPILIVRRENQIFAIAGTCSHLGAPLAEGALIGDSIQCPWHGSRFALEGGRVLDGPAVHPATVLGSSHTQRPDRSP